MGKFRVWIIFVFQSCHFKVSKFDLNLYCYFKHITSKESCFIIQPLIFKVNLGLVTRIRSETTHAGANFPCCCSYKNRSTTKNHLNELQLFCAILLSTLVHTQILFWFTCIFHQFSLRCEKAMSSSRGFFCHYFFYCSHKNF